MNRPHDPNPTADASGAEAAGTASPGVGAAIGDAIHRGAWIGDRYAVTEELGKGGMGVVWQATDTRLNRAVALKFVRGDRNGDEQLLAEGKAMAQLKPHSNVVVVYDADRYLGQVCLVLQFIDGVTLGKWQKQAERSWREVVSMYAQAGEGLLHAHLEGWVHRDFKAENVLVDKEGRPHVSDFGLARDEGAAVKGGGSKAVRAAGTPGYMSPEQMRHEPATPSSDQFSFCAALYRALYGELPYGKDPALPLPELAPPPAGSRVPRWVREVVVRGLSESPKDRYPSMRELLQALADDPARRRRSWALAGLVVAALSAVVAGAVWIGSRATVERRECEARAGATFEQIFGSGRQQAIASAFVKVNPASGAADFGRVRVRLEPEAASWRDLSVETCRLSDLGKKRMQSCLEERRKTLATISTMFASADERIEEKALSTVLSEVLPSSACVPGKTQSETSSGQVSASDDPLDEQLARARLLRVAGKYDEATNDAMDVADLASNGGKTAVEAEARLLVGTVYKELFRADADVYLKDASVLAERISDDRLRLEATLTLSEWYIDKGQEFFVQANEQFKLAEAILQRIGGNPLLSARVLTLKGRLASLRGDDERAVAAFREALELRRQLLPADHPEIALAKINLALAQPAADAIPMFNEVRGAFESLYGPEHPEVGSVWHNIGVKCDEAKDWPCAMDALGQAVAMRRKTASYDPSRLAHSLIELTIALNGAGKHDSAIDALREAIELLKKAGAPANEQLKQLDRLHEMLVAAQHPREELEQIDAIKRQITGTASKPTP